MTRFSGPPGLRLFYSLPALLGLIACARDEQPERTTFYQREIAPTVQQSCATSPTRSGCHISDGAGNAFGNLSFESYETLTKRRDLLVSYGPYGIPGLLLKAVPPYKVALTSWKDASPTLITTDIAHAGDQLIDFTSPTFTKLDTWIRNGAAENNAPAKPAKRQTQPCSSELGVDPLFDANNDPPTADFSYFADNVNSVLGGTCAASNCHGSPANSLYLTCGDTPEQIRWNYFAAADYTSTDPAASELLRRTLAPTAGGTFHEGGTIFESSDDSEYQAIQEWATQKGPPTNVPPDEGFEFFSDRVQPMLVKRGCMMLGCHSASMFHDYRLRGGSGGHFGLAATRKNYFLTLDQLALESPDPNASRLIKKNLSPYPDGRGISHRGGALFGSGGDPASCDLEAAATGPLDEQPPYCVIVAWFQRERASRLGESASLTGLTYVRRPPASGLDRPQDWDVYQPGAEVVRRSASFGAGTEITLGDEVSLSEMCNLPVATTDARRPAVSWDGQRLAFAARSSAGEPFKIYVVEGDTCAADPTINAPAVDDDGNAVPDNGELVHNFDPTFAPDGRIVFVSTRGNTRNVSAFSYSGPQRTPSDPSKLNSNVYVREPDGSIRQLTFVLNQELTPSFMRDGRAIFTSEKRAPGFYQLAGRRINLDGGDYHPLFGQRPTIGYDQVTDIVELADKNFAAIMSEHGAAHGAGTLALVNRSLGVDHHSDVPEDYLVDPDAISRINPEFFQHSVRFIDAAATGKLAGTQGAYRSPSPLPDGRLLVSYAPNVVALDSFSGNFDVYVVDPVSGQSSPLITGAEDELWPVAIYARVQGPVFTSRPDEANAATRVYDDERKAQAKVTVLDIGVLSSLLFQNTRTGRPLSERSPSLIVWESLPPEPGVTSYSSPFVTSDQYGQLYVRRQPLGELSPLSDDSGAMLLRGGVPIVLQTNVKLAADSQPTSHFQREEMQFYPGEDVHQSFRREFFNGLCGGCHGSLSGQELDNAVNPDILTQASDVEAKSVPPSDLTQPLGDPQGPDFP